MFDMFPSLYGSSFGRFAGTDYGFPCPHCGYPHSSLGMLGMSSTVNPQAYLAAASQSTADQLEALRRLGANVYRRPKPSLEEMKAKSADLARRIAEAKASYFSASSPAMAP